MNRFAYWTGSAPFALAACAGAPMPTERAASSEGAIRAAHEVGAEQVPQAALHLKLAQEQLDKGKAQMNDGDNDKASYTLLRAQTDAELALAMARENRTRYDAQQVIDKVRSLRGERPAASVAPAPAEPAAATNPADNP